MSLSLKPIFFVILLGYIWILFKYWKNRNNCFSLLWGWTIFIYLFCDLGYFLKIGTNEIKYYFLGYPFMFLYTFFNIKNCHKANKDVLLSFLLLHFVVLLGIFVRVVSSQAIYGINHDIIADSLWNGTGLQQLTINQYSIIVYFEFLVFSLSILLTTVVIDKVNVRSILKLLTAGAFVFLILSYIEFVINNISSPTLFRNIVISIFGLNKSAVSTPYYRIGLYSILVTCQEPSYVAITLFYCNLIFIANLAVSKNSKFILFLILSTLISVLGLTLSSIVFALITCVILCYVFWNKVKPWLVLLVFTLPLICLLLMNLNSVQYFVEKSFSSQGMLGEFINSDDSYASIFTSFGGSVAFREFGMLLGLKVFFEHFLIGVGLGTFTSTSGLISLLSNIGILGFLVLVFYWKSCFKTMFNYKLNSKAIVIGLLTQLFLGGISNYTFSPLLIVLIFSICLIKRHSSEVRTHKQPVRTLISYDSKLRRLKR